MRFLAFGQADKDSQSCTMDSPFCKGGALGKWVRGMTIKF
jgi:hypothetical protein